MDNQPNPADSESRLAFYRRFATLENDFAAMSAFLADMVPFLRVDSAVFPAEHFIDQVADRPRLCDTALALWLTNGATADLGDMLLRSVEIRSMGSKSVRLIDLRGLTFDQAALCTLRICAKPAEPSLSLAWTCAIAVAGYENAELVDRLVAKLLAHHAQEFPISSHQLLNSLPPAYKDIDQVKKTRAAINQEHDELERLPSHPELSMTEPMRMALAEFRRRENEEILRGGREDSFLASLCKPVYLKYSYESAVEIFHGQSSTEQTFKMGEFSLSYELPLSETLDPQNGWRMREQLYQGKI